MNAILEQINSIGAAFVEFAWPMLVQSSVLIVILLLVDLGLRKRVRAVFRYCIWMLVLVKVVLPSSLSSPMSVGYLFGDRLGNVTVRGMTATAETVEMSREGEVKSVEVISMTPIAMPMTGGIEPVVSMMQVTWQGVVFLVWLVVVGAMVLLLLQRALFVRGLVAQAKNANSLMTDAFKYCCRCIGVKGKVGLKVSANATSPAVCGLFRPVILVPNNIAPSLGAGHLRTVLLHELAHIKRCDLWVNLVQTVLQIIYFYNPLLWLANAVIRRVREQAVDETVQVTMGERAQQYPETLVNVAKLAFKRPALSLRLIGVVESESALKGRIKHMLNRPIPKSAKLGLLGLAVVLIIGAVLLPMAKADNLTHHAHKAMELADQEARRLNHEYIGTEHILLALVGDGRGVAATILKNLDVDTEQVRVEVDKLIKRGSNRVEKKKLPQTPRAKKAMEYAREEAGLLNHDCVSNEHILLGLLRDEDGVAAQVLINLGVKYENVRQEVIELVGQGPIKGGHPTLVISGVVKDAATDLPIAGVKVGDDERYVGGRQGAITDAGGRYSYITWPEHHGIKVQAAGYRTQSKSLYTGHFTFNKEMVEEVINFTLEPEGDETALFLMAKAELRSNNPLAGGAAVVVRTMPAAFANDVSPRVNKIKVTFDQPMMDGSWSWVGGGDTYPETTGQPSYDRRKTTCTLPVKLEPGKVYWIGINNHRYKNFKTAKGEPALPYMILFATKGKDNEPTRIPENYLEEAKEINSRVQSASSQAGSKTAAAPLVVRTTPAAFANDVSPRVNKIKVTFDQPMMNLSWSWVGGGDTYPETTGQPSYDRRKMTCTLPVKLKPGKFYWVGINSPQHKTFQTVEEVPARPYVILFATKGVDGEPTTIPDNYLKEAKKINSRTEQDEEMEMQARVESAKKLSYLGKTLLVYANDHEEKYPDTLQELRPYDLNEWVLENVEYLGKGKTVADNPNTVIAYDRSLLEKGNGTNVLFNDAHVEFFRPEGLEDLGIKLGQNTPVDVGKQPVEEVKGQRSDASKRKEGILAKLSALDEQRRRVQRDLAQAEQSLEEVRGKWGFTDLEERSYRHPVTERLMRLEQERDNCFLEMAQLRANIENLLGQPATSEVEEKLKKVRDNLAALQGKLKALDRMVEEAKARKRELDRARIQYKQRANMRDERQVMLNSLKGRIEELRIVYDEAERR